MMILLKVLFRYYPEIIFKNPAIGRQGKAMRRQHNRRILESNADSADSAESLSHKKCRSLVSFTQSSGYIYTPGLHLMLDAINL